MWANIPVMFCYSFSPSSSRPARSTTCDGGKTFSGFYLQGSYLLYVYASVTDQPNLEGDSGVFQHLQTRLQFYF